MDGLSIVSGRTLAEGVYRDRQGAIRLIETGQTYERMVNRAFDKVRQSGANSPAVAIRMLDGLANVAEYTISTHQRAVLMRQADMILRAAVDSSTEQLDMNDIRTRYDRIVETVERLDSGAARSRQHWTRTSRRDARAW